MGVSNTLQLTVYSMVLAIVLGVILGDAAIGQPRVSVGVLGVSMDIPWHAHLRAA